MKSWHIISVSIAACITLYVLEQILAADYATKTAAKVLLFTAAPFIYWRLSGKRGFMDGIKLSEPLYVPELLLGAASFAVIFLVYFLLGGYVDFGAIAIDLSARAQVNASNYPFVGGYIVFGNSFLEELFFRGFVFLGLYRQGFRKTAYIYSSALFGVYHLAIIGTWISFELLALAMAGLFLGGFVFCWLDSRRGNIAGSWIVHILADSAIVLIGMNMFNLI